LFLGGLALAASRPEYVRWAVARVQNGSAGAVPRLPEQMLLRAAHAAETKGNTEEAVRLQTLFLDQHPQSDSAEEMAASRVRGLIALGEEHKAADALNAFRTRFKHSPEVGALLLELAAWQQQRGDVHDAARNYTSLVALVAPRERADLEQFPRSQREQRQLFLEQQRQDEERDQLERAARFNLALCLEDAGDRDEALRAYERFALRFPGDPKTIEAVFRIGMLHMASERVDAAAEAFASVCQTPEAPVRYYAASVHFAGRCLELLQRPEDAKDILTLAFAVDPDDDPHRLAALRRLGRLSREREPLRALEAYRDVVANTPDAVQRAIEHRQLLELESEAAMASLHP
jgi:tetratricopeptide (TPR) repeat protein